MFVDIADTLMRKQEFLPDDVAAKIAGSKAQVEALQLTRVGHDAFSTYWNGAIVPLLRFGNHPIAQIETRAVLN